MVLARRQRAFTLAALCLPLLCAVGEGEMSDDEIYGVASAFAYSYENRANALNILEVEDANQGGLAHASAHQTHFDAAAVRAFNATIKDYAQNHPEWLLRGRILTCALDGGLGTSINQVVGCFGLALLMRRALLIEEETHDRLLDYLRLPGFDWRARTDHLAIDALDLTAQHVLCERLTDIADPTVRWSQAFEPLILLSRNIHHGDWLRGLIGQDDHGVPRWLEFAGGQLVVPRQDLQAAVESLYSLRRGAFTIGIQARLVSSERLADAEHLERSIDMAQSDVLHNKTGMIAAVRCAYGYMPNVLRSSNATWFVVSDDPDAKLWALKVLRANEGSVVGSLNLGSSAEDWFGPSQFLQNSIQIDTTINTALRGIRPVIIDFESGSRLVWLQLEQSGAAMKHAVLEAWLLAATKLQMLSENSLFGLAVGFGNPHLKRSYVVTRDRSPRCYPVESAANWQPIGAVADARDASCWSDKMLTPQLLWLESDVDFDSEYGEAMFKSRWGNHGSIPRHDTAEPS